MMSSGEPIEDMIVEADEQPDVSETYFKKKKGEKVTLFVGNQPPGLDEVGLRNLFLTVGNPMSVRQAKDSEGRLIGFVDFSHVSEAITAIQELHRQPPLYLRVEISKNEKGRNPARLMSAVSSEAPMSFPSVSARRPPGDLQVRQPRGVGRGLGLRRSIALLRAYREHVQSQLIEDLTAWSPGPSDVLDDAYIYFPQDLHEEANFKVLDSLTGTAKRDSKRFVAMGRGYFHHEKKQRQAAKKYWQSESNGVYTYGQDVEMPSNPCCRCRKETVMRCMECGTYYCSENCKARDWDNHRDRCKFKICIDVIPDGNNGAMRTVSLLPLSAPLTQVAPQTVTQVAPQTLCCRPAGNVVNAMEPRSKGVFEVARCSQDSASAYGTLCCREVQDAATDLVVKLPSTMHSLPVDQFFNPQKGAMVGVHDHDSWWRGFVLDTPPRGCSEYKVALCEVARVVSAEVSQLKQLPPNFANLPELGVEGQVVKSFVQGSELWSRFLKVKSDVLVSVDEKNDEGVVCTVTSEDGVNLCQMMFRRWDPEAQLRDSHVVELSSGSGVVLTAYHNQHALFVRPTGKHHVELRNRVLQQVAASHVTGVAINRPPRRGEMVACECPEDGNFYRAIVWSTNPDQSGKYKVWFVDFGNWAEVERQHMKELPQSVKNVPYLAAKVALKDVGDQALSVPAALFLNQLLEKEEVMKINFGTSVEGGVDLFIIGDGTHVNERINTLLQPTWKTASDKKAIYENKVYMLEDLMTVPLIEEDAGRVCSVPAIVLHVLAEKGMLVCCPANSPIIPVITTSLASQINEFCESPVSCASYCPRKHEICLARLRDGTWQRALSVESTKTGSIVVFLDYGDTEEVQFPEIRRILPEFMETPMLVSVCQIKGLPAELSDQLMSRLKVLIRAHSIITLQNIKNIEYGTAQYEVDIPEVLSALHAEDLI